MVRFFIALLAVLFVLSLFLSPLGCTAAQRTDWLAAHPTTQLIDHAGQLGGAAVTTAMTGNPTPLVASIISTIGWLVTGLVAKHKANQLAAATAPWDGKTRRRAADDSRAVVAASLRDDAFARATAPKSEIGTYTNPGRQ
jgi:hypothetical protein